MCGILAAFGLEGDAIELRQQYLKLSKLMRHRGPDDNGVYQSPKGDVLLGHERLSIIDPGRSGRQPFEIDTPQGRIAFSVNSEIYNHQEIRNNELSDYKIELSSDSVVLGYLFAKYGCDPSFFNSLKGIFASMLYNETTQEYMIVRDPIGICPIYWGKTKTGAILVASEMKAIADLCETIEHFPPGHAYCSTTKSLVQWYKPVWMEPNYIANEPLDLGKIKKSFVDAVVKRLMSDVPLCILLSGGLDSSLVASVAVRHLAQANNCVLQGQRLHTFSIGLEGAPDLAAARKVADFLGTVHHEFHFTVQQGIDALRDLVWHIESFEQVRAAIPMYLLTRQIKAMGYKVVMSGEGADEIFGGYLYFHKAPSADEFHKECVRKVTRLHVWDVLRANKSPFAWGIETRVPFLDRDFVDVGMTLDAQHKMCQVNGEKRIEKWALRAAFDDKSDPYLPNDVLWRQKEQFSDGVGYDWVDGLKSYAEQVISDTDFNARATRFPVDPPRNKEYYLLRSLFEEHFPNPQCLMTVPRGLSVACSTPEAVEWDPEWKNLHEISGRVIGVHEAADGFKVEKGEEEAVGVKSSVGVGAQ